MIDSNAINSEGDVVGAALFAGQAPSPSPRKLDFLQLNVLTTAFRFGVVGVLTAVIHYGLLYSGVEWLSLDSTFASSVGFVVAVSFNYFMHYSWTFAEPAPHGRTLWRYLVMIVCGFLINGGLMFAGVNWTDWHYLLVQTLVFVVVISWNIVVSSLWVFRS